MRAEDFSFRLEAAAFCSWRFASTMIKQKLPPNFIYSVTLNASYDGHREQDEVIFPEDDFRVIFDLDIQSVVSLLVRNERVPQWIDISVCSCDRQNSYLHLLCCGRYHSDDDRLSYHAQGSQPFGIKGPQLPHGCLNDDGRISRRFKLPKYKDFQESELKRRDQIKIELQAGSL
ncbi:MAG: hypothetical protein AAF226_00805 [Verrucomicrobiota bacterium]